MPDAVNEAERGEELEEAAGILENLLTAADGGGGFVADQFEASTILALLYDPGYYARVKEACDAARDAELTVQP